MRAPSISATTGRCGLVRLHAVGMAGSVVTGCAFGGSRPVRWCALVGSGHIRPDRAPAAGAGYSRAAGRLAPPCIGVAVLVAWR